ncbi:anti-sigma factor [Pararhizobium sp.]|uniref:anti-sigma factor n=1 Tax=Pararhizobium sp. TaxID=1977563 RepID=UPI0027220CD4|nr:anti-sigma factor [Pararhizobium sp.]MDO9416412.1 anti-sigma factor [Pararhizobium sp.]
MNTSDRESGDYRRDEVIAGEYVLGVLSADDRRKVEARMVLDRNFAAIVNRWEENLSTFDDAYEDVLPPARVFTQVERRLFPAAAAAISAREGGFWNSLVFWRGLSFASLIAVAGFAVAGSGLLAPVPKGKPLVAELTGEGNSINLVALYDSNNGKLRLTPVAAKQGGEKSLELWLVDGDSKTISLGVLPQTGEGEIVIPEAMQAKFKEGATLAVSLEPYGGSPTGVATGPVLAVGKARDL